MQTFKIFPDIDFSEMQLIKGGAFMMGSDKYDDEKPIHEVHVKDFYIGKYPVTQALWEKVMGSNPSHFKGRNRPVEQVSWDDIKNEFLPKLNELTNPDGSEFRLLTEAEWEYAAKGNQNYIYSGSNDLEIVGWYDDNSHQETKPVGLKNPNGFGLYDMSGNVWEWCEDYYHDNYQNAPLDGTARTDADKDSRRVLRGGSWSNVDFSCRVAIRAWSTPALRISDVGFRVARGI
jgi:formylglycine-generating enzyme